jgi:uroporphyrinogen decarboxylase
MDLSAEAEAFGATVRMADHKAPCVVGRLVGDVDSMNALGIPKPGTARTAIQIETVRRLSTERRPGQLVLGFVTGPYSLASRLWGTSEFLVLTATEPDLAINLLEKVTGYLVSQINLFKQAGADGVVLTEPTAGLLSPRDLVSYSAPYVSHITEAVEDDSFGIIMHSGLATTQHLGAVLESGTSAFHFGAHMDMAKAIDQAGPDRVVCGNLDPETLFVHLDESGMRHKSAKLHECVGMHYNFVASSGCDIPPHAPLATLDAFMDTMARTAST